MFYSDCLSFHLLLFFWSQNPILDTSYLIVMFSVAPLGCAIFWDLTLFLVSWPFWELLLRCFCGLHYYQTLPAVFFHKTGVMGFGKNTEVKHHFHHIISRVHTINMSYGYWCSSGSSGHGRVFQFLHFISILYSLFFPLKILVLSKTHNTGLKLKTPRSTVVCSTNWTNQMPPSCTLWREITMHSPHVRSRSYAPLPWRWSIYINYLEFFCMGYLSFLLLIKVFKNYVTVESWIFCSYLGL